MLDPIASGEKKKKRKCFLPLRISLLDAFYQQQHYLQRRLAAGIFISTLKAWLTTVFTPHSANTSDRALTLAAVAGYFLNRERQKKKIYIYSFPPWFYTSWHRNHLCAKNQPETPCGKLLNKNQQDRAAQNSFVSDAFTFIEVPFNPIMRQEPHLYKNVDLYRTWWTTRSFNTGAWRGYATQCSDKVQKGGSL